MADEEIGFEICLAILIPIIVVYISLFYFMHIRGRLLIKLPEIDINLALEEIDEILRKKNHQTGIDYSKKGIIISDDILKRCQLYLKKSDNGNIAVYSRVHMPNMILELMVILFFLTIGIVPIFMDIIYYHFSRKFVKKEIFPLISNHSWEHKGIAE